jgi:hypothetical protein
MTLNGRSIKAHKQFTQVRGQNAKADAATLILPFLTA